MFEGLRKRLEDERNDKIRSMVHASEGALECDHNADVSEGDDNGAYVQCWVWVDFSGTPLDKGI